MAWPHDAYVGQRIVCVHIPDDYPKRARLNLCAIPSVGEKYTVRAIECVDDVVCLTLVEIVNRSGPWVLGDGTLTNEEPAFRAVLFRPIDPASKKADRGVARLRSFLKDAKQPVEEEA